MNYEGGTIAILLVLKGYYKKCNNKICIIFGNIIILKYFVKI